MEKLMPGGHIDQMIRQTRNHHVQLSSLADSKANMLMTTASVVMTLCVGYIMNPRLKWAAMSLMIFSLATIFLAVYAAMPKIAFSLRPKKYADINDSSLNLLFFGDFINFTFNDYESAMLELMKDPEMVYKTQLHEIYYLGNFLAKKKYRFLRIAYIVFLTGFLSSAIILVAGFTGK